MSDTPLRLEGVSHSFGAVEVLCDLRLAVARGEFLALVGPSGCGKTTLLNLLSGFLRPVSGAVHREGKARTVYQHDGLFPWLTVAQNIAMGLEGGGRWSVVGGRQRRAMFGRAPSTEHRARERSELDDLLALIGLKSFADHYPHQLSGGMRQRVELARALAGNSDVLLMDEPFSALDYQTRLRMRRELVRMLKERPRTVVFVTHDIEEAAQLADRVVVLSARPARIVRELVLDIPRPRTPTHPGVVAAVREILRELGLEEEEDESAARGAECAVSANGKGGSRLPASASWLKTTERSPLFGRARSTEHGARERSELEEERSA